MSASVRASRTLSLALALAAALAARAEAQQWCTRVREVMLSTASLRLSVGDVVRLSATAFDAQGVVCRNRAAFTSSNVNVVRVNASGTLTALAAGVAIVTASAPWQGIAGLTGEASARAVVFVVPKVDAALPGALRLPAGIPQGPAVPPGVVVTPFPGGRPPALPVTQLALAIGLDVRPERPVSDSAWLEQAALIVDRLEQAARRLTGVFSQTAGVPLAGAASPADLSVRERFRWEVCRRVGAVLGTHAAAARELAAASLRMAGGGTASQAARALEDALRAATALDECDWIVDLIRSPDRAPDWGAAYGSAATRFYASWYAELRSAHEAARALAQAVRALLPPERAFDVPPALPPTPPTIGGQ